MVNSARDLFKVGSSSLSESDPWECTVGPGKGLSELDRMLSYPDSSPPSIHPVVKT